MTAKIDYAHDFRLADGAAITPKISLYWQSKKYLRELNLPIDRVDSYTQTNLSISYTDADKRWEISAFVRNLEDRRIRSYALTALGHYFSDYMPPRTFGASASFRY